MHQSIHSVESLARVFFDRFFEDWRHLNDEHFLDYLQAKIDQSITYEELESAIKSNRRLKIKFGIDPTGPDVHLGHVVPIMLLRQFQKAGHEVNLIIGDFTAMIGDPSGRNSQRLALSASEVRKNFKTYELQIGKYINTKKIKVHKNSKWLSRIKLEQIIQDLSHINLSQVLQRDDFRTRIADGHALSVSELLYSYAQGIDSVVLENDIELGGRDQLLNFAYARTLMNIRGQKPQVAITTPVLEGVSGDGRKMSKSFGNYIPVNASGEEKFGKIMSIPDTLIQMYFIAFADVKESEKKLLESLIQENPLEAKKQLGQFLVSIESGDYASGEAECEKFENKFSKKVYTDDMPTIEAPDVGTYFDVVVLSGVCKSKGEITRLFEQKGVNMIEPEERVLERDEKPQACTIRIGKTSFFKVIV